MDEALRMSGLEARSGKNSETVRRIASSDGYGGSLKNLARDLEYASEEQPCWTQPLTSPKNQIPRRPVATIISPPADEGGRERDEDLGVREGRRL